MHLKTKLLSSLVKVFPSKIAPAGKAYKKATALCGEIFSFQVAFFSETKINGIQVEITSPLKKHITLRNVKLVPAELVADKISDELLRKEPGLFPDPLVPVKKDIEAFPQQWRSLWITLEIPTDCRAQKYPINIYFKHQSDEGTISCSETFSLTVMADQILRKKIYHTEWFHADCLMTHYRMKPFSARFWKILYNYFCDMDKHGITHLLTPLFTLPLDTAIGGERPTLQLVKVFEQDDHYSFDFTQLKQWLQLAQRAGINYFEFSHLFTQWGAAKTPKIIVNKNGKEEKKFGWDVDALGNEYKSFLSSFLPALLKFLKKENITERCIFHISDEPEKKHMKHYRSVAALIKQFIPEHMIYDATSCPDFFTQGIVNNPIPGINEVSTFRKLGAKNLWTYYCCGPWQGTTNRFLALPALRTRVLGLILYYYDLKGFLHWGYNFWFKRYSTGAINPFHNTDAGGNFPAGDAFLVYPGKNGPLASLRYEVLTEGFQDYHALKLLEQKIGRSATLTFLKDILGYDISDTHFPDTVTDFLKLREQINLKLQKYSKTH